jgi:hypothetical protein
MRIACFTAAGRVDQAAMIWSNSGLFWRGPVFGPADAKKACFPEEFEGA